MNQKCVSGGHLKKSSSAGPPIADPPPGRRRFRAGTYPYGHGGVGFIGTILIIVVVLMLLGRL
jgi:hypothetical protein